MPDPPECHAKVSIKMGAAPDLGRNSTGCPPRREPPKLKQVAKVENILPRLQGLSSQNLLHHRDRLPEHPPGCVLPTAKAFPGPGFHAEPAAGLAPDHGFTAAGRSSRRLR